MRPFSSMRSMSGVVTPSTTSAPRPKLAFTTRSRALRGRSGARVNMTPATFDRTMRCSTTAIATSRIPWAARYARARPEATDAHTARIASPSASSPKTPRRVSARPAIETIAPSSHVALERTAKPQGALPPSARHSSSSSTERPRGRGARSRISRASAARSKPLLPPAARRRDFGSHPGGSSRSAAANASTGSTHASGTSNSCFRSHARCAPLPPMARGSSAPRFLARVARGTIQELMGGSTRGAGRIRQERRK